MYFVLVVLKTPFINSTKLVLIILNHKNCFKIYQSNTVLITKIAKAISKSYFLKKTFQNTNQTGPS